MKTTLKRHYLIKKNTLKINKKGEFKNLEQLFEAKDKRFNEVFQNLDFEKLREKMI